jgi:glycosyltransferase involved in cell wall biosynthesis
MRQEGRVAAATGDAPVVLLLGPTRSAVSGVATHLNYLFRSELSQHFRLRHFVVGSEGQNEGRVGRAVRLLSSPLLFATELLRCRPAIVHINTSMDRKAYWRDLAYLVIARLLRFPVVYQAHGGALPLEFHKSRILRALLRRVLQLPEAVVLLGQHEVEAYRSFARRASLVLIPNAVPINEVVTDRVRSIPPRPLRIGYLGRLTRDKGLFEIVTAMGMLRDRGVEATLTIAGSGADGDALHAEIVAQGLEDRCYLAGPLAGNETARLWRECDALAMPTYREALPYALLEGMEAGVVPVVSPVGAIPEVIEHRIHGLLVPPRDPSALADALGELASDRALLYQLGRSARMRILDNYSMDRLSADFLELYRRVARKGSPLVLREPLV